MNCQCLRPWKVLCALYHLKHVKNNPHYNDITSNEHWQEICEGKNPDLWEYFTNEEADNTLEILEEIQNEESNSTLNSDNGDWRNRKSVEDEDKDDDNDTIYNKLFGLPYDTCIPAKDLTTDTDFLLSLAQGEGQKPISIYTDKHGEEVSFLYLITSKKFVYNEV